MSTKHLGLGSTCPPKEEGKFRLYSMMFCPYVQRVMIVLNAKGLPYDIVNVNLKRKPEWLFELHPEGKVPALDTGDNIMIESINISDYLDEKYSEPPLYPGDKAKDKELIAKLEKLIINYTSYVYPKQNRLLPEIIESTVSTLSEFEAELAKLGTLFFSGEQAGMVDYMIWPWMERARVIIDVYKIEEEKFPKEKFAKVFAWERAMHEVKPVKDSIIDPVLQTRFFVRYLKGDHDNLNFDDP